MTSALPLHMADDPDAPRPFTLKRWSQRKLAAARATPAESVPLAPAIPEVPVQVPSANVATTTVPEPLPLPPVESLNFDSDYSPFMQPKVDESTRRAALKKLFSSPSFNVMDGLDIYVGDYTQSDPMPAGMLDKLSTVYAMLDTKEPPPVALSPDEQNRVSADAATAGAAVAIESEVPVEAVTDSPPEIDKPPSDAGDSEATTMSK